MKKIDVGQIVTLIANVGVIGGILMLAYELQQNNELKEAEARQARTSMVIDSWNYTAEHGDLYELKVRGRNGDELSEAEISRIDASIMAVFVMIEWTFRELGENSPEVNQMRAVQRYNWENKSEYPRVWGARKSSFDPAFVQWMEENVINR